MDYIIVSTATSMGTSKREMKQSINQSINQSIVDKSTVEYSGGVSYSMVTPLSIASNSPVQVRIWSGIGYRLQRGSEGNQKS